MKRLIIFCALLLVYSPSAAHGQQRLHLDDGSYFLPRFSPDGRNLAFAKLSEGPGFAQSPVYVHDLQKDETHVVFSGEALRGLGTYAAIVVDLWWESRTELSIGVWDGDVGMQTRVVELTDADTTAVRDAGVEATYERQLRLSEVARAVFPGETRWIDFDNEGYYELPDGRVLIYQGAHLGLVPGPISHALKILDFERARIDSVREWPGLIYTHLGGNVTTGSRSFLLLRDEFEFFIAQYERGHFTELYRHSNTANYGNLKLASASGGRVILEVLPMVHSLSVSDCILLSYEDNKMEVVHAGKSLMHGDLSPDGRLLALNWRVGDRSIIEVIER